MDQKPVATHAISKTSSSTANGNNSLLLFSFALTLSIFLFNTINTAIENNYDATLKINDILFLSIQKHVSNISD